MMYGGLSIVIFAPSWQKVTPMKSNLKLYLGTDMEINRIQILFDKYRDNYTLSCKPATESQLQEFRRNCMDYGVPAEDRKSVV